MSRVRIKLAYAAFTFTFACALVGAAPAAASTTIGQTSTTNTVHCTPSVWELEAATGAAPGYVVPAGGGVITSWSTAGDGSSSGHAKLKLYRATSDLTKWLVVAASSVQPVPTTATTSSAFPTRIPVTGGELLGILAVDGSPACLFSSGNAGDVMHQGQTDESPGNTSTENNNFTGLRANVAAVIEPDADKDGFGDETQDQCIGTPGAFNGCPNTVTLNKLRQKGTKVKVTATVPGAGTIKAGSPSDPALASASAKKSLKLVTKTVTSTSTQRVVLTLKLTKSAKRKLAARGKLKIKVKVIYTPPGGPSGSQTGKVKLVKKH